MKIRIDKLLSDLNLATRSDAKKIIRSGSVEVNGIPVKDPSAKCDPDKDIIFFHGEKIVYEQFQYFMLNKPAGCITATQDTREQTVMEFLPKERHKNVVPVGRLDKDTEGLLLLTDDGELNHRLMSPAHHVEKTYFVRTDLALNDRMEQAFLGGIDIGEKKPTAPAVFEKISDQESYLTITEGKFHQVKRMYAALGYTVIYLKRVRMGSLVLDRTLMPGECRLLTQTEVEQLKQEG